MPFGMGFGELILILLIVLVIFGGTRLPGLGDGLRKLLDEQRARGLLSAQPPPEPWTRWDWLTVCVAVLLLVATMVVLNWQ